MTPSETQVPVRDVERVSGGASMKKVLAVAIPLVFAAIAPSPARAHGPPPPRGTGPIAGVYTEVPSEKCRPVKDQGHVGVTARRCPGIGNYALLLARDGQSISITVVTPDGKEHPLKYGHVVTSHVSDIHPRVEWRVIQKDEKPIALIVRVTASESADPQKTVSYLAVAKITPGATCVTDMIASSPSANDEARRVADVSARRPCLR